jgi:hypothetical protein
MGLRRKRTVMVQVPPPGRSALGPQRPWPTIDRAPTEPTIERDSERPPSVRPIALDAWFNRAPGDDR